MTHTIDVKWNGLVVAVTEWEGEADVGIPDGSLDWQYLEVDDWHEFMRVLECDTRGNIEQQERFASEPEEFLIQNEDDFLEYFKDRRWKGLL